jgi:ribosomal protein L7/L12
MHIEREVFELRRRVDRLERQVTFLLDAMELKYQDEHDQSLTEIRALLAQGRKVQAIKLYRRITGAPLKTAKEFIESLNE